MNLEEIWQELVRKAAGQSRHGILQRRILPDARCDLFIAVERPSGRRVFLIRVQEAAARRLERPPRMRGCEISITRLPDDPADKLSVCVFLNEARFTDVFTSLSEDLARHLEPVQSDVEIVNALVGRLQRWQKFLQRSPDGLGEDAQRGLFGELWFMRHYLIDGVGALEAVRAWRGPENAIHDYQLRTLSVEVKTTIAKQHTKFLVSSERQLDSSRVARLVVFHVAVEAVRPGTITLPALVSDVRSALSQNAEARDLLEDLLLDAGYLDRHEQLYENVAYVVRSHHAFHVRDGFPRLTETALPPGVGDLSYSVVISNCVPFIVEDEEFRSLLQQSRNA
jgi:Putative  PD-(D/E)XK family member, (DUF4420)